MKYIEIRIETTPEGIEPLGDRLTMIGADAFSIQDETDMLSFLDNNRKYWDYIDEDLLKNMKGVSRIVIYVCDDEAGRTLLDTLPDELAELKAAREDVDFGSLNVVCSMADDDEWLNSWRKYYKPFAVGERIYVCPEWEEPGDTGNRVVYVSDPGLAFGSGIHETTRLCMELLEKNLPQNGTVLDMGCGSGILAVVGLLLGAESAFGVDVDDKAVSASEHNAALNNVSDKCTFVCGDLTSDVELVKTPEGGFDVVCANIVADVLIFLAPYVCGYLKDDGAFLASGIIDTRLGEVCEAFENYGLRIASIKRENGWCAVLAHKNLN